MSLKELRCMACLRPALPRGGRAFDNTLALATALAGAAFGAAAAGSGADDFIAAAVGAWGFHVGVTDGGIDTFGCGGLSGCGVGVEFWHGAVHSCFFHGFDFGHGELGLTLVRRCHFAVAWAECTAHPTEDVVGQ